MPATRLFHLPQPFLVRVAGLRDDEVARHDVGDARAVGVELERDHASHDVALGEDAHEARAVQDRDRAHPAVRHVSRRVAHRLIGAHVEDLAPGYETADRLHASSSASSGWRRNRRWRG